MTVANAVIPNVSISKSCVSQNRAAHSCKSNGQRERAETNRSDAPLEQKEVVSANQRNKVFT